MHRESEKQKSDKMAIFLITIFMHMRLQETLQYTLQARSGLCSFAITLGSTKNVHS